MSDVQTEMPQYRSHKKVWALKLNSAEAIGNEILLVPDEDGYAPIRVPAAIGARYMPKPGDYFVQYEDGYQSFSPAKAFEEGYTRIVKD